MKQNSQVTSWADELDATDDGKATALPELSFSKLSEEEHSAYGRSPPGRSAPPPRATLPPSTDLPRNPPFKVFVRNLPNGVNEQEISAFFGDLQVRDVHILTHADTGNPKGCFVEFATAEELGVAISRDGSALLGRPVHIEIADPKPDRRGGFGGGGFGGGGGGGFGGAPRGGGGFDDDRERPRYGFSGGRYEDEAGGGGGGGGQWSRPGRASTAAPSERLPVGEREPLSLEPIAPRPRSNPFGNAKPIDTDAKLKELEARDVQRKAEEAASRKVEVGRQLAEGGPPAGGPPGLHQAAAAAAPSPASGPGKQAPPAAAGVPVLAAPSAAGAAAVVRPAGSNGQSAPAAAVPAGPPKGWAKPAQGPIDVVDLKLGADIPVIVEPEALQPPRPEAAAVAPAVETAPLASSHRGGRGERRGRGEGRGEGRGGFTGRGSERAPYAGRSRGRGVRHRGEGMPLAETLAPASGGDQQQGDWVQTGAPKHTHSSRGGRFADRGGRGQRGGRFDGSRSEGSRGEARGRGRSGERGRGRGMGDQGRGAGSGGGPPGLGHSAGPPMVAKEAPKLTAVTNPFDLLNNADD